MSSTIGDFIWGHMSRLPAECVMKVTAPSHGYLRAIFSSDLIPDGVYGLNYPLEQFEVALARQIVLFQSQHQQLKDLGITWDEYVAENKQREATRV